MSNDTRVQIEGRIAEFGQKAMSRVAAWLAVRDPAAFRTAELEIAALGREVADEIAECVLRHLAADVELQAAASLAGRQASRLRHGGRRGTSVTLLGGKTVRLTLEYLEPNHRRKRPGRRRRVGRRGKGGAGFFPLLAVLGIWFGVTPALAGEICRQVADSDSVRAGRAALARRGIDMGHKRTLRIVNKFGGRAVEERNDWLQKVLANPPPHGVLAGKRVAVATDGGRLRQRLTDPRGRPRANGHRGYDGPWREPKLLTIYVIGPDGAMDEEFHPVYDGTLGDADAIFDMLAAYLKALGIHEARQLIFLGDGAKWIWERVPQLAERLGLDPKDVVQVIDWSHVVGVLYEIADVPKNWTEEDKQAWLRRAKNRLHKGKISELLEMIDGLAVGRRAKDISEHRDYFARNVDRMQYAAFESAHIPTGSGAIESAIRRVVNMRMKSNGMFWLEVNAESMLLMRSYLKSGYLDTLVDWSNSAAIPWWTQQMGSHVPSSPLDLRKGA
jgi:hypothetical protein